MIDRNFKKFAIGYTFVLLAFQSVQQYVTIRYNELGHTAVGFNALIIIYASFILGSFFAPIGMAGIGPKKSMAGAAICYILFIWAMMWGEVVPLYIAAVLIGFAAAYMWNGQMLYINKMSVDRHRINNAGFFNAIYALGNGAGIALIGFCIAAFSYENTFLIYSLTGMAGIVILCTLNETEKTSANHISWRAKMPVMSSGIMKMASTIFINFFLYGLVISQFPLEIAAIFKKEYVGLMSVPFFIVPALVAIYSGRLTTRHGEFIMLNGAYFLACLGLLSMYFAAEVIMLITGILLFTLSFAIMNNITTALPGIISPAGYAERITGTFIVFRSSGIVAGILIPKLLQTKALYLAAIAVVIICALIILPLSRHKIEDVKDKIKKELTAF